MADPDRVLTAAGRERLQAELTHLRDERRPALLEQLRTAREAGVWDSPDYLSARDELAFIEGRIATLERLLAESGVLEPGRAGPAETVEAGTTVTIRDEEGEEEHFTIVSPAEADPLAGRVSYESPVGRTLMHHRIGDTVTVETPGGTRHLTITAIR